MEKIIKLIILRKNQKGEGSWINGGFFVLKPEVINKIKNDGTSWEKDTLPILQKKVSFLLINMMVFGCPWIHFVIKFHLTIYGTLTRPLGKNGKL